jgi:hypothetical protein
MKRYNVEIADHYNYVKAALSSVEKVDRLTYTVSRLAHVLAAYVENSWR